MKEISIENLAYYLKQASDRELPKPIFFLGAGASYSGKIPLASGIEKIIKDRYKDNPDILMLGETDKTYSRLMGCLSPIQRNELLSDLIDAAKINVTHIYLAQLIKNNLVDYVLTANFDNLMLRALALFDIFPPVYDLTSISDFTTTTIKDKSVVYLHGQHNGTWLLNTDEEMAKVNTIVPRIFDTIKNKRPWIFLGYSGNDPIFEHIKSLGRFDNGLYWVGHDDYLPSESVQNFLNKPNTNAHFIKGYDADAFMLKLNHELGLKQPDILDKPFSSLKNMLSNIVDIDDEDHFRGAKVRLEIARKNVDYSIHLFEDMGDIKINKSTQNIDRLKKDIIDLIISEQYDEDKISEISSRAKQYADQGVNDLLGELFFYLGNKYATFLEKCNVDDRENFSNIAIESYKKSIEYMPYSPQVYYNWGLTLSKLAERKIGKEAEALYEQAIKKYEQALVLDPNDETVINNLGVSLSALAKEKVGKEAESLCRQAIERFKQVLALSPKKYEAVYNWGNNLLVLANLVSDEIANKLYTEAFEKFQKVMDSKSNIDGLFSDWALGLSKQAEGRTGNEAEALYQQAFEKYEQALEANCDRKSIFYNWGVALGAMAHLKTGVEAEALHEQAIKKYKQALILNPNDETIYNNWAVSLTEIAKTKTGTEAEAVHEQAIKKYEQALKLNPNKFEAIFNWGSSLIYLANTKTGTEAEALLEQAIEKYDLALNINSDRPELLTSYGQVLMALAGNTTGNEARELYRRACKMLEKAYRYNGKSYALACCHHHLKHNKDALDYLRHSLETKEVTVSRVVTDGDWKEYEKNPKFKDLIKRHRR